MGHSFLGMHLGGFLLSDFVHKIYRMEYPQLRYPVFSSFIKGRPRIARQFIVLVEVLEYTRNLSQLPNGVANNLLAIARLIKYLVKLVGNISFLLYDTYKCYHRLAKLHE